MKNFSKEKYSKVKNLIFDVDNTLVQTTEEDAETYREALINAGFSDEYFYGIYQMIDVYDQNISEDNPYYNKEDMIKVINEGLEQNFTIKVIDEINKVIGEQWIFNPLISEKLLDKLSERYNLYVYTNYFGDAQIERLRNLGFLKYFKKVFSADKNGCKQFKKCFESVLNEIGAKPEECLMIGDSKINDIIGANNVEVSGILFDYDGKRDLKEVEANDYIVIFDMKDLEKLL